MNPSSALYTSPHQVRLACRNNTLASYASEALGGFLCVNVVMMDRRHAPDFRAFCEANPVSCPLLHMSEPGETVAPAFAADLDVRTDLRSYDVIRDGRISATVPEVADLFTADTVTFLIGSSVSLDGYLTARGMGPAWGPCIYLTNRPCVPVGPYRGVIAVTMRAYPHDLAGRVAEVSSHFPACHGAPIARNDPAALGITDELKPFLPWRGGGFADPAHEKLYWACGITPSLVAKAARLPLMIVHTPGNALITDIPTETLRDRFDLVKGLRAAR